MLNKSVKLYKIPKKYFLRYFMDNWWKRGLGRLYFLNRTEYFQYNYNLFDKYIENVNFENTENNYSFRKLEHITSKDLTTT